MQAFREQLQQQQRYEVADFYGGIVTSTFDLEVREDLQKCMVRDEKLVEIWDQGISSLSKGEEDEATRLFGLALARFNDDLEPCIDNAKLNIVTRQFAMWWDSFWGEHDTDLGNDIIAKHKSENKLKVMESKLAMRLNWETGYYYDAGKRFGNLWKIMIGAPEWIDELEAYYGVDEHTYSQS